MTTTARPPQLPPFRRPSAQHWAGSMWRVLLAAVLCHQIPSQTTRALPSAGVISKWTVTRRAGLLV